MKRSIGNMRTQSGLLGLTLALLGSPCTLDFIGTLDAGGLAEAKLSIPGGTPLPFPVFADFAWCTVSPFDFASNAVELILFLNPG